VGIIKIMKPVLCVSLLFAVCALADDAADRIAIEKVITSLNEPRDGHGAKPLSILFTSDADRAELGRLSGLVQQLEDLRRPWLELATPWISTRAIRFVTPDVALVDAKNAPYGSVMPSLPVLFVMKKVGRDWRIASFREMNGNCMPLPVYAK
jgi:hypothetical protein